MPSARSRPMLAPRHRPTQERGRQTVEQLLDTTAILLEEEGFEALTTNKIAARAGINVASLYKYFPNKYAVLRALAERNMERQREIVLRAIGDADDWRESLDKGLDAFMKHLVTEPGFAALADAIRVSPALRELETAGIPVVVQLVADRLRQRDPGRGKKEVEAVARVIVESGAAVLMAARLAKPAERKRLVRELKRMLECYLMQSLAEV